MNLSTTTTEELREMLDSARAIHPQESWRVGMYAGALEEVIRMRELYEESRDFSALLTGIEALKKPNYHALNKAGLSHRLLHALLCAYLKHNVGCCDIGWSEVETILDDAISEALGDEGSAQLAILIESYRAD